MGNSDRRRFLASLITAMRAVIVVFLAGCVVVVPSLSQDTRPARSPEYTFKILREFPHDVTAFTQGLAYRGGFLYEGTGLKGRSSVRKVRLETGEVVQQLDLPSEYFGEGITLFKNEIIEVTWQSGTGFVYDATNFRLLQRFSYKGEGWGLTTDGHDLFMSDGTDVIRVLDPNTFAEKRHLQVHDVVRERESVVVVADAKYKRDEGGPRNPDIYQVITYGTVLGCDRAYLVYPATELDREYVFPIINSPVIVKSRRVDISSK